MPLGLEERGVAGKRGNSIVASQWPAIKFYLSSRGQNVLVRVASHDVTLEGTGNTLTPPNQVGE